MFSRPPKLAAWLFGREEHSLLSRWLFLRALGLIYFSAFFSLVFQINGLIGPQGILPAGSYLERVATSLPGALRFWYAPSVLWLSTDTPLLLGLCWAGMLAALLVVANVLPRAMLAVCFVCFLSFVSAAQEFAGYQSDGMLLEAGFLALFFAPAGVLPGWGAASLPSRASCLLLLWEWFRIYFESGIVKLRSGDPTWRNLSALDEYYQNGPLPTWIGWYLEQLPHAFHIGTAALTLLMELGLVFLAFLPRPCRIACFLLVTVWQAGVILTANYCFLNYLVLALGFLLLDDQLLRRLMPAFAPQGLGERRDGLESSSMAEAGSPWRGRLRPVACCFGSSMPRCCRWCRCLRRAHLCLRPLRSRLNPFGLQTATACSRS